jgi:pimeloyl-ACP methyl ester carboxylesterase
MVRAGDSQSGDAVSGARDRLLAGLPIAERRLDVDGISTAVLVGGSGDPLVLLHGIGSFAAEWSLVIPRLVERHRVIVPDLPGLGSSDAGGRPLDADTLTTWLLGLIEQTCDDPPTLVGHSAGGGLAARSAIRYPRHARRVVLMDASSLGLFRPRLGVIVALIRFGAHPDRASRDRFLRQVLADPQRARVCWGERWDALEAYDLEQAGDKGVGDANSQLVRQIGARRIPEDRLRAIEVPISLVWGMQDRLIPFRIAKKASIRFGWPLVRIDGCGHGPQIEQPHRIADILEAILRS